MKKNLSQNLSVYMMRYYFFFFTLLFMCLRNGVAQPLTDFTDYEVLEDRDLIGLTFTEDGTMYVWSKGGLLYITDEQPDGTFTSRLILDISEEVGNWRDYGLISVAFDPNFDNTGYVYLSYVVDRHHLLYFGTPSYDSDTDEYYNATIGRVTRYTILNPTDHANSTADYSSRQVLVGETKETGVPVLHESHGIGTVLVATDGSLIISCGDGASYGSADLGSSAETYFAQALTDGIIRPEENVGSFRSQLLNSHNGKILRIDPTTGDGLPSNPFYDAGSPRSARSRVWALGARNPFRMTIHPNTGSHTISDGDPGVFYFGDVGWARDEELNIVTGPGQNFGWPAFEGMTPMGLYFNNAPENLDAPNPLYDGVTCTQEYYTFADLIKQYDGTAPTWPEPCNPLAEISATDFDLFAHKKPTVDWRIGVPQASIDGVVYDVGSATVPGPSFVGNASTGGVWYTGDDFPAEYKNTYFHADYGANWIRRFGLDANDDILWIENFAENMGSVVSISTSPTKGSLYYIRYREGVRKILYTPGGSLPPTAVAMADVTYSTSQNLTVQFNGVGSYDPEGAALTYLWEFGDNSTSNQSSPSHTFSTTGNTPVSFTVKLTVTDVSGNHDAETLVISLNNSPPVIQSTSIDDIFYYSIDEQTNLGLTASVIDAEHGAADLDFEWQTILYHNNHNHPEPTDDNQSTTTLLSPVGCDGEDYYYGISLIVTDAVGLSDSFEKFLFPDCGGGNQPPSAAFTANPISGEVPLIVTFDASSSYDPDGNIVSYDWDFGDGNSGTGVSTSHTYTVDGTYQVTLTVTDDANTFDAVHLTIRADPDLSGIPVNLQPIADAFTESKKNKIDQNFGQDIELRARNHVSIGHKSYLKFNLTGQGSVGSAVLRVYGNNPANNNSVDVAVFATTDDWTENDISNGTAPVAGGAAIGSFSVNNTPAYHEIDVTAFVQSQQVGDELVSFILESTNVDDERAHFNAREEGSNPPELVISGAAEGQTNQAPNASFQSPLAFGVAPFSTFFDASTSNDPDGEVDLYSWNFGDGAAGAGQVVGHTFEETGSYQVILTVTDNKGKTNNRSTTISVFDAPDNFIRLDPVDDAYTDNGADYRDANYGLRSELLLRNRKENGYLSYLKFDLSGQPTISSATLRLYGSNTTNGKPIEVEIYAVSDNWDEESISFNNAPASGTLITSFTVNGKGGKYYEIDLTDYISREALGDDQASIVLKSSDEDAGSSYFNSKEASSNVPQLILNGSKKTKGKKDKELTAPSDQLPVKISSEGVLKKGE